MTPSIKAIIARFNGSITQAISYCKQTAKEYPQLRDEYRSYARMMQEQRRAA